MIVGMTDNKQMLIGVTAKDIEDLQKGLTKVKDGGPNWPFRSLILFTGETDQDMIDLLSTQTTIRSDNIIKPKGGG